MLRAEEAASEAAPSATPPKCAFPAVAGCTISLVQREVLVVFAVEVSEVSVVLPCKCFHNDDGSPRFADLYCLAWNDGNRHGLCAGPEETVTKHSEVNDDQGSRL